MSKKVANEVSVIMKKMRLVCSFKDPGGLLTTNLRVYLLFITSDAY